MSTSTRGNLSLALAITSWGTMLGGIVYAHLVYFRAYLSDLPASAVVVNGPYGLHEAIFWAIIHPLNLLFLALSLWRNWGDVGRRRLVATAIGIYIVVLVVSSLYFIPQLGEFQRSPQSGISAAEWRARSALWMKLSIVRGAVCFSCIVPLLMALARPRTVADAVHK